MENDIFIPAPFLPPEDIALATTRVVSSKVRSINEEKNELQRSTNDENRAIACFTPITTPEAALNELSTLHSIESGLFSGKGLKGTFHRSKRISNEPHSSKNGGERAFDSSPHSTTSTNVKSTARAPPVRRNQQLTLSSDSAISISAIRAFEKLNELCSSKNGGEQALASSPHHSTSTKEGKILEPPLHPSFDPLSQSIDSNVSSSARRSIGVFNELQGSKIEGERVDTSVPCIKLSTIEEKIGVSQYQQPHNNPATSAPSSAIYLGIRCSVDKSKEPSSSKTDGKLASASTLSKELNYYGVRRFPLRECQPGCHFKSWLFQARNHVRWRCG